MMTYQNTAQPLSSTLPARAVQVLVAGFAAVGKALDVIGAGIMRSSEASSRTGQIEALQAKSDAELAAMGISRDTIVHYVFKDLFYA